jgi:CRISPR system Cascade subunit CasE
MYLSRIELNTNLLATKKAMASPQLMHAVVEGSFPANNKSRNLWRVDKMGNSYYLLVSSEGQPDFRHIVEQFGWPLADQKWETKDYWPFLKSIHRGQQWSFRLRANPIHNALINTSQKRGKVRACTSVDDQKKWLEKRCHERGFELDTTLVVQYETRRFNRKGTSGHKDSLLTLRIATFEGVLKVEDPELLVNSMCDGIGRAKAYGCGLLTLARL